MGNDGRDGNSILPGESCRRLSYRSLPRLEHARRGPELRYLQGQPDAGSSVDRGKEEVKSLPRGFIFVVDVFYFS